ADAGVEFVPDRGMRLNFGRLAHVHMHAERKREELHLGARAEIDGEPVTGPWLPIGDHGIYAYEQTPSGFAVTLAPTPAPLPALLGNSPGRSRSPSRTRRNSSETSSRSCETRSPSPPARASTFRSTTRPPGGSPSPIP